MYSDFEQFADNETAELNIINALQRMPDDANQQDKTANLSLAIDADMFAASSD